MRRLLLASVAVSLAAALATCLTVFVFTGVLSAAPSSEEPPSQGSLVEGPGVPEEDFPAYSQVVDNSSPGDFLAPGWKAESSNADGYGEDYRVVEPSEKGKPAQFKVKIPASDVYSVYAWWPADKGNNTATRFGVSTTAGVEWTELDQRTEGGLWIKLGEYEMEAGEGYAIQVSPESGAQGRVIADAVAVVRGILSGPPDESYGEPTSGDSMFAASSLSRTGKNVVRVARKHKGTPYRRSPPHPCRAYRMEDCSCHTKVVFRRFNKRLPDSPAWQWRYGKRVRKSQLRPGDLVFFDENRNGRLEHWDHVGIYSGNGYLVHGSGYYRRVVESKMKYIRGYWGAKRLFRPR
jgi:cell wall-associated NlpC family hydrolase